MSSALAAIADELATYVAPVVIAAASITPTMQLLVPATAWDWPTDSSGTSSAALYTFCSWMPQSAPPAQPFTSSSTRFADSYRLLLQSLPPSQQVTQALTQYADDNFYTTVLYGQSQQPRMPAWNISQFPQAWLAEVSGGSSTAGTIHIDLPADGLEHTTTATCFAVLAPDKSSTPVPLGAGAGQSIDIYADAWGQISIRPAGWYNGALASLQAHARQPAGFFGPSGILRNMLTGLCVAWQPAVTASVTADFADRLHQVATPESRLRAAGFVFDTFHLNADASPNGNARLTASTAAAPSDAVIVAATVAPLDLN